MCWSLRRPGSPSCTFLGPWEGSQRPPRPSTYPSHCESLHPQMLPGRPSYILSLTHIYNSTGFWFHLEAYMLLFWIKRPSTAFWESILVFDVQQNEYQMSRSRFPLIHPTSNQLGFLNLHTHFSSVVQILSYDLFKYATQLSFLPPFSSLTLSESEHLIISFMSLNFSCIFLFFLFLCATFWIISSNLSSG